MPDLTTSRTLVKSAPELWAECSDAASLTKHLGAFGEIRITKLEPETAVAWEGEAARGTVRLEPSGWGTRVILTAVDGQDGQAPAPPEAEPVEVPALVLDAEPRRGRLRRILFPWPRRAANARPPTPPPAAPEAAAQPPAGDPATRDALDAALDSLGRAHHRPYSRA
jgi:hypothetical protein